MIKEHVRSQISSALKDYKQCLRQSLGRFNGVEFRKQQKGPYGEIGESPQWNTQLQLSVTRPPAKFEKVVVIRAGRE